MVAVQVATRTWEAPAGTFVYLPWDLAYGFRVAGDQPYPDLKGRPH